MLTKRTPRQLLITAAIIVLGIALFRLVFPVTSPHPINLVNQNSNGSAQLNFPTKLENINTSKPANITNNNTINTHPDLMLVGIVESNNENSARAVIVSGDKENTYATGALLDNKNTIFLKKIMKDHVIINNNGHDELLWLRDSHKPTLVSMAPDEEYEAAKDTPSVYGPPDGYIEAMSLHPTQQDEERALADINRNLLDVASMSIQRIDNNRQLVGYKIQPGLDANKFNSSGLRANDMVTAINGIPVTKPDDILASYKNRGNAPISLEIERDDNVISIEVNQTL